MVTERIRVQRNRFLILFTILITSVVPAEADVIFLIGNVPQDDENILFNAPGLISTGTLVTGITTQTNVIFQFTSTDVLITPSQGQARIEAADDSFNVLTIQRLGGIGTFESAIFNLTTVSSGIATLTAVNSLGQIETQSFNVSASGQNFFTLTTDAIQSLSSISISGVNLSDVRQIRAGGAQGGSQVPPSAAIPEPSTILLLGTGLVALAGAARYRHRRM